MGILTKSSVLMEQTSPECATSSPGKRGLSLGECVIKPEPCSSSVCSPSRWPSQASLLWSHFPGPAHIIVACSPADIFGCPPSQGSSGVVGASTVPHGLSLSSGFDVPVAAAAVWQLQPLRQTVCHPRSVRAFHRTPSSPHGVLLTSLALLLSEPSGSCFSSPRSPSPHTPELSAVPD